MSVKPPPMLELTGVGVSFTTPRGPLRAAEGVSFQVPRGSAVGLVGESGSGKSVTALAVLQLLGSAGVHLSGSIRLDGEELVGASPARLRSLRGRDIALVFQDPMAALNPSQRVGVQVAEPLRLHLGKSAREGRTAAVELLRRVGVAAPEQRVDAYPHELSGGMRQRVVLAMAIACQPRMLIADEPTTALDVTVQAQVMELLNRLQLEDRSSLLLISHDLALVSESCENLVVMYAGRVVERGPTRAVLEAPRHPYTAALLASSLEPGKNPGTRFREIPGLVPDLARPEPGCRFAARCPGAQPRCRLEEPTLLTFSGGERAHRCHFPLASGERSE